MQIVFNPNCPLDEIYERAVGDLRAYRHALQSSQDARWSEWAGDNLAVMMNSPIATSRFMAHRDTALRLTAASLTAEYWPPNEIFARACIDLALADPEPSVRGAAIKCLISRAHPFIQDPSGTLAKLRQLLKGDEPPISDQDVHSALRSANAASARVRERFKTLCEKYAGPHLPEMRSSCAAAEAYLRSSDPNLRRAALLVLFMDWRSTADFRRLCEPLIREDPNTDVRIQAQDVLVGTYAGTDDIEIGRNLAHIVEDESQPTDLRKHAYASLSTVRAMPARRWLDAVSAEFRFPEDVDWQFVGSFL